MIRQKRKLELEFIDSNGAVSTFTVGDLRNWLKTINSHKLPDDQPLEFYSDPYRFGFRGFLAEWEEWNNGQEEET